MDEWTGWLGIILLAIAFIPSTIATIKKGKSELKMSFLIPYSAGVLLVIYYSILLNGMPFVALNIVLLILLAIDIYFAVFPRKENAKSSKRKKARN